MADDRLDATRRLGMAIATAVGIGIGVLVLDASLGRAAPWRATHADEASVSLTDFAQGFAPPARSVAPLGAGAGSCTPVFVPGLELLLPGDVALLIGSPTAECAR
ncbi:MAG: hypothetical protein IPM29_28295 [Planctomycetes bacterium]|nr:hypothetical protein [Planctomycetota bacterium]